MNRMIIATIGCAVAACDVADSKQLEGLQAQLTQQDQKIERLEQRLKPSTRPAARRGPDTTKYTIAIEASDPQIGPADAPVTIVEASEFACPYCARLAPVVQEVVAAYPQSVRWVPKAFVVHPQVATQAALAVCAAHEQGRLHEYEAALWKKSWPNGRMSTEALKADALVALAGSIAMDTVSFKRAMQGQGCANQVQRHQREMRAANVSGTPTLFINGVKYVGPRTVPALKGAVEALLN